MEWSVLSFPVSGVQTWVWLPPLVAFAVSFFTSMVGVSGAFLLLPFQMSVLHYVSPSVSATNLVFNLVATPGGVYRYGREGRMVWPLAGIIVLGTLPGIVLGWYVRTHYLTDVRQFKVFVGAVLLYVAYRLLADHLPWKKAGAGAAQPHSRPGVIEVLRLSSRRVGLALGGEPFSFSVPAMFLLAGMVGVVGGIYGIGGGAIMAPFCVAVFRLPVHAVAGAALAGTLATSVFGVALYSILPAPAGMTTQPDWALGLLFGLGGFLGMYAGARCQKFVPHQLLKGALGVLLLALAVLYLAGR